MVEIDDRGRFTIPREIGLRSAKAVIISAGTFFVVIPIKGDPYKLATSWLKTEKPADDLKNEAEALASKDAAMRMKRREQPC